MKIFVFITIKPVKYKRTIDFRILTVYLETFKNLLILVIAYSSVQSLRSVRLFATPWTAACQASLSITNSWSLSNSWPSSRWCRPTISSSDIPSSSCFQSFPASESLQMSQFSSGSHQYCSFSFSINPSNEYSGLISFRMDSLDLLEFQGTHKSLLQHHI